MRPHQASAARAVAVIVAVALVAGVLGWLAWQAATQPDPRPRTLAAQVGAIPGVRDVRVESHRLPGQGAARSVESRVTFDESILDQPSDSADRLANVSHGWSRSEWRFSGLGSTATVHYVSQVDKAPFAWWLEAVALLRTDHPGTDLACDIRYGSLDCTVTGGNTATARQALRGLDAESVREWVAAARPDPGEPRGFTLR